MRELVDETLDRERIRMVADRTPDAGRYAGSRPRTATRTFGISYGIVVEPSRACTGPMNRSRPASSQSDSFADTPSGRLSGNTVAKTDGINWSPVFGSTSRCSQAVGRPASSSAARNRCTLAG